MYDDLEALLRAPGRPNYAPDPYGNTLSMAPPPPRNGLGQQYDPQMDGRMQDYDLSGGDAGQSAYQPPPQPSPDPYAGMLGSGMASSASRLGMGAVRPSIRSGIPYQGATISPEANGTRPYDPFNSGLQPSPFMVKDSFMENGPVHTLGYSSRHGISQPTVDYSGMAQRAGIDRYNMDMSRMLGNQEIARMNSANDMERFMMQMGSREDMRKLREESDTDKALAAIAKMPPGPMRDEAIRRAGGLGRISPDAVAEATVGPAIKGMNGVSSVTAALPGLVGKETNLSSLQSYLEGAKGITRTKLESQAKELQKPGLGWGEGILYALAGVDKVDRGNMDEKQGAEFDMINKILAATKGKAASSAATLGDVMALPENEYYDAFKSKGFRRGDVEARMNEIYSPWYMNSQKNTEYRRLKAILGTLGE